MNIDRNLTRVLAAAVASTGFAFAPMPAFAASLTCTAASFTASPDGAGNITISCTEKSTTTGGGTTQPPPTDTGGGTTTPPVPSGPISCAGYSKTIVLDLNWGGSGSAAPRVVSSGFGNGAIVVARFTTPANTAPGVFAAIAAGEWGDQPTARTAALSQTPCDFPSTNPLGRYATLSAGQQTPSVNYAVGGTSRVYAVLQPSTTYYFNVKNAAFGKSTCTSTTCNIFVELQKPNGL